MPVKIEVEKRQLDDFKPSEYCQWCVTITTDDPAGLGPGNVYEWAIDLPPDTDILDPEQAKLIKGAPDYKIDPKYGQAKKTQPGQKSIRICFVAACKERRNTEVSLERRINPPPGSPGAMAALLANPDDLWERVPFDGGPDGVGKIPGPAAVAFALPSPTDTFAVLASFEAAKINALLGVVPKAAVPRGGEIAAVSGARIRVGAGDAPVEKPTPIQKPRRR